MILYQLQNQNALNWLKNMWITVVVIIIIHFPSMEQVNEKYSSLCSLYMLDGIAWKPEGVGCTHQPEMIQLQAFTSFFQL